MDTPLNKINLKDLITRLFGEVSLLEASTEEDFPVEWWYDGNFHSL